MFNFKQDEKRLFLQSAFIKLKEYGFIPDFETDTFCEQTRISYHAWGGDKRLADLQHKYPDAFPNEAIRDFAAWVSGRRHKQIDEVTKTMVKRDIAINRLGVEVSIPLGTKGRMVFKAEGDIPSDSDAEEKQGYYADLFQATWNGYLSYVNRPSDFSMAGVKKTYEPQSGDTVQTFNMTSIIMVNTGGKREFKVKGDKFPLHGVRVFGEVLITAGIDPSELDGEKYVAGKAMYTSKANGEPFKVVSIQVGTVGL